MRADDRRVPPCSITGSLGGGGRSEGGREGEGKRRGRREGCSGKDLMGKEEGGGRSE